MKRRKKEDEKRSRSTKENDEEGTCIEVKYKRKKHTRTKEQQKNIYNKRDKKEL